MSTSLMRGMVPPPSSRMVNSTMMMVVVPMSCRFSMGSRPRWRLRAQGMAPRNPQGENRAARESQSTATLVLSTRRTLQEFSTFKRFSTILWHAHYLSLGYHPKTSLSTSDTAAQAVKLSGLQRQAASMQKSFHGAHQSKVLQCKGEREHFCCTSVSEQCKCSVEFCSTNEKPVPPRVGHTMEERKHFFWFSVF